MSSMPLTELIRARGFDRRRFEFDQDFQAYGLQCELTYGELTSDSAMRLDFISTLQAGRVTVWESGLCDLEVLDATTGQQVFWEHHDIETEEDFYRTCMRLVVYMQNAAR